MSFGDTMGYLIFGNPISQGLIGVVSGIAKSTGITPKNTNVNNAVVPVLPPPKVNLQDLIGGNYNFVRLAGISGGAAVIMGAYGKAIIDRMEDPMDQKEARTLLKTANRFHFFHTLALMTMPLARKPYLFLKLLTWDILSVKTAFAQIQKTLKQSRQCLRQPINPSEDYVIAAVEFEIESKQILHNSLDKLPLTSKMITYETAKDKVLVKILEYVTEGWPSNCNNSELKAYFNRKNDICIVDGCLMFGQRIIIPQIFRKRILKEIHRGHQGIGRTKAIARNYVYWSNIDYDIEAMVKSCSNCAAAAKMPKPFDSWERLHIDYAGPIDSYYYLVVIDAFSKWPEIIQTKSITATQTISSLKEIFARFGLPKTIVSDNGTQFVSHQFQQFLAENGISHIRSSPYYPMSNGQAERFVDTLKRALKKLNGKGVTAENLQTFLQVYRSTPNKQNEDSKSPAEVLLKRNIRIKLDLIKPTLVSDPNAKFKNKCDTQLKMKAQFDKRHGAKPKFYEKQELVYVNIFKNKHFEWTKGKIIERIGNVIYNVRLQNGKLIRAHANQIRDRKDQGNELSLEICTSEDIANEKCLVDAFGLYETTPTDVVEITNNNMVSTPNQSFNEVTEIAIPQTEKHNEAVVPYTRPRRTRHPVDRYRP
ncbi:uncharacterized protein K02A2.6-like [Teleopsis dalmanni]|uniref:uncharacterized protein K02A2.6-like n=1 Tax=Teleopsis dalmanni TaxID=139649 RepID=UPI0018CF787A|nr:uncharacterized protein K02A2.6-like [Teleopsis dalmanni]